MNQPCAVPWGKGLMARFFGLGGSLFAANEKRNSAVAALFPGLK